jgi:hypothetical protein
VKEGAGSAGDRGSAATSGGSLRLRLAGYFIGIVVATLALLTAAGILEERRRVLEVERRHAGALLEHLAGMPEFRGGSSAVARAKLAAVRDLLQGADARVDLVPRTAAVRSARIPPSELTSGILGSLEVVLDDGPFLLRYRADPGLFRRMARRSLAIHGLYGVVALAALLAGMQWILRRRLLGPLARVSHKIDLIRKGGGWLPVLPSTDRELEGLTKAIAQLGPGLERQVNQWIEAERRAGMADLLLRLRKALHEPRVRLMALAGDLQARDLVLPEGSRRLRDLLKEVDRIEDVLRLEERDRFGQAVAPPETGEIPKRGGRP